MQGYAVISSKRRETRGLPVKNPNFHRKNSPLYIHSLCSFKKHPQTCIQILV
jgi:hypothetical protein